MGLLLGLLLLLIVFSLLSAPFRRVGNLMFIILETAVIGIVAAGQTLVVLTGGIDLSVGSVIALTGIIAAALMKYGLGPLPPFNPYLAIVVALAAGAFIGMIHGLLITKRGLQPFIVTLATMSVLRGIALVATGASPVNSLPDSFKWVSDAYVGVAPMPGIIMLVVFLMLGYVLRNAKLGRYAYAIGGNETATRLSGVPVDRYKTYVYMLSGFLAALAGIIQIARIDCGTYTNGEGYELGSVAAVIIGGTNLHGGVGGVWGTLVGVLILAVVRNGLVMLNVSPLWHHIVSGSIILLAVLINVGHRGVWQLSPKIQASQTVSERSELDKIVSDLGRSIERRFGSPHVRVYMIDPATEELIECQTGGNTAAREGSIASQARVTGLPAILNNLTSGPDAQIVPLGSGVRSAVAIPLTFAGRIVGALEMQSVASYGFDLDAVRQLVGLVQGTIGSLNDAWLLERGWMARQTRDTLRHLWDDAYLERCPLAEWASYRLTPFAGGSTAGRGAVLRRLLLNAIENLSPAKSHGDPRGVRRFDILRLTYVEGHAVDEVIKELCVSRRQYFYDLKGALDVLAHLLVVHQVE
jgi:ribose transport system permease protein